ncbi:MAG: ATP phosphoribosyltransferase regulatory subunit [Clostridia bacterium]|nr:ATP phosphoribosyltransferase regulatory subunit [Clostridia bacterium]
MHEEALLSDIRKLYENAGFRAYKMRKFEEYSLYLENRDFLLNDYVITFSDMSGRLLALKPDVTLSIVKGTRATKDAGEKLYYMESVYRLDSRTNEYREIRQMGLEALGDIDDVQTLEIVALALRSLVKIDDRALMDISHMGIVKPLIEGVSMEERSRILSALRAKNAAALTDICSGINMDKENADALKALIELPGDADVSLELLEALSKTDLQKQAVSELKTLVKGLSSIGLASHIRLDFSIVNDVNYYTGIVFQGYVRNAYRSVLSGGRYDGLTEKFKRGVGALGFAIYLNDIQPDEKEAKADADILLTYSPDDDPALVFLAAEKYRSLGKRVRVEKKAPCGRAYESILEVNKEC